MQKNDSQAGRDSSENPFVLCLAGATGTGKTKLAIALSKHLPCEIINADSRQLYADFPVLSAQPSEDELGQATHHLYGILKGDQKCNAMNWAAMAAREARKIVFRGHLPLIVGGTGFYFETLLKGLSPMPAISQATSLKIMTEMEQSGTLKMYDKLLQIDPEYARIIHPHDRQRISRALEVQEESGQTFSWWRRQAPQKPQVKGALFVLDKPLDDISPGLLKRIDQMLAAGALDEVATAKKKCPDTGAPGWSCIGSQHCLKYLAGDIAISDLRKKWHADTRSYAKRQITWFRARKYATWVKPEKFIEKALAFLSS